MRDLLLERFFFEASNVEAYYQSIVISIPVVAMPIYSILGPRYLKLLKRQRHKESISCKEEEPITLNHVMRVRKKKERGPKKKAKEEPEANDSED